MGDPYKSSFVTGSAGRPRCVYYIYIFPGGPLRPLIFHSLLEQTIILAGIYNPKFQLSRVFIGVGETPNGAVWLQIVEPQFIVISFQRIVLKSFFNQGVVNQSKSSPLSFEFLMISVGAYFCLLGQLAFQLQVWWVQILIYYIFVC